MIKKNLFWIPRILTFLSLLFMTMFSFDVFNGTQPFVMKLLGFIVQNIPVMILIVIFIIAWKWELAGGILFVIASVSGTFYYHSFSGNPGSLVVIAPFLLAGVLFILYNILYGKSSAMKSDQQ